MQHAKLWKRILNEGYWGNDRDDPKDSVINAIIKSPIISCGGLWTKDRLPDTNTPDSCRGMSFPFRMFWLEQMQALDGVEKLQGFLVFADRNDEGTTATSLCFQNSIHHGAAYIGSMTTKFLSDGSCFGREFSFRPPQWNTIISKDGWESAFRTQSWFLISALLLASCKNVSLASHDNDPKQVRRAIKRHGGTPESYRYYTLVVRPPGAKSDAPSQDIGIMPRHVCRGHFAEYGPEFNKGLLFGKYAGRFYIPPHLKGDKKNGVVEKDYELAATISSSVQPQPI